MLEPAAEPIPEPSTEARAAPNLVGRMGQLAGSNGGKWGVNEGVILGKSAMEVESARVNPDPKSSQVGLPD